MITIVPATIEHAEAMAGRLRAGDAAEVAAVGVDQRVALVESIAMSITASTALVDGVPAATWGVTGEILGRVGCPWFLTTDVVRHHRRALLRLPPLWVAEWRAMFPLLQNWVLDDYGAAKRWLKWLGFTLHDPAPYGPFGAMFRRFTMGA